MSANSTNLTKIAHFPSTELLPQKCLESSNTQIKRFYCFYDPIEIELKKETSSITPVLAVGNQQDSKTIPNDVSFNGNNKNINSRSGYSDGNLVKAARGPLSEGNSCVRIQNIRYPRTPWNLSPSVLFSYMRRLSVSGRLSSELELSVTSLAPECDTPIRSQIKCSLFKLVLAWWIDVFGEMVRRKELRRVSFTHLCATVLWLFTCFNGKFGL